MNPNKSIDICILDNCVEEDKDYIKLISDDFGFNVLHVKKPDERKKLYESDANVFIICYTVGCESPLENELITNKDMINFMINGEDIAKEIRKIKPNAYIHVVYSRTGKQVKHCPKMLWDKLIEDRLINSYSKREDIIEHLLSIGNAVIKNQLT